MKIFDATSPHWREPKEATLRSRALIDCAMPRPSRASRAGVLTGERTLSCSSHTGHRAPAERDSSSPPIHPRSSARLALYLIDSPASWARCPRPSLRRRHARCWSVTELAQALGVSCSCTRDASCSVQCCDGWDGWRGINRISRAGEGPRRSITSALS